MFYQLPPVGNPICWCFSAAPEALLREIFSPYIPRFFASGTAALAAAMIAAGRVKKVQNPAVILPAYGCPDLISAAVFAGVRPVLVDLEPDRPWMNLDSVAGCITADTVAIIAVDLFGIPDRIQQLRAIAIQHGVMLIEDSAQAFPGESDEHFWGGDLVVVSFGRGKPVSLLGGGAVLFRDASTGSLLPDAPGAGHFASHRLRLKILLYNLLSHPRLYWIPQGLPFLHLGETRYHPLPELSVMDELRWKLLAGNIEKYRNYGTNVQDRVREVFVSMDRPDGMIDLPGICSLSPGRRLLRYPVLVPQAIRDELYRCLRESGQGASVLYPATLPRIEGLQDLLGSQGPFPVADEFASRVLTFPTHSRVSDEDVGKLKTLLVRYL